MNFSPNSPGRMETQGMGLLDERSSLCYTHDVKYVMPPPTCSFSSTGTWRYALMSSERDGISSKETHNSRNAYKETLFVGVLNHPVMEPPGFSGRLFGLCALHDLLLLCQALTYVSHKTLSMRSRTGSLSLVRMISAESLHFL